MVCLCVVVCVVCVFRSYHDKGVFVCLGTSLRDVVGHVLCACVIAGFVFCLGVCVLFVEVV